MPEIILKNVTKRFGKFVAVDNLNLTIPTRSFITLLGPSGCGKTTTLLRARHQRPAQQARRGLPVPELRALAAHDRVPEHRLRS